MPIWCLGNNPRGAPSTPQKGNTHVTVTILSITSTIASIRVPAHNNLSKTRQAIIANLTGESLPVLRAATPAEIAEVKAAIGKKLGTTYNTPAAFKRSKIGTEQALVDFVAIAKTKGVVVDFTDEIGWIWQPHGTTSLAAQAQERGISRIPEGAGAPAGD